MSAIDLRVRRPEQHEELIRLLMAEARFPTLRDVLIFAAALGFSVDRRVSFDKSGEPIDYNVLTRNAGSQAFISMLAAVARKDDPEILDLERLADRVHIFEDYANGGLEYLQEQINSQHKTLEVLVRDLVTDGLTDASAVQAPSAEELLKPLK